MPSLQLLPFLEVLFSDVLGQFLELRAYSNPDLWGHKRIHREFFRLPVNPKRLVRFVNRHDGHWHIAFGCAPRADPRGTQDAVRTLTCLWADIDFKADPERDPRTMYSNLLSFNPGPSLVNFTGNGLHAYWLFSSPVEVRGSPAEFKRLLRGLQLALRSDMTHDLSRVFRLPGTQNVKDPKRKKRCEVWAAPCVKYPLGEFGRFAHASEKAMPADRGRTSCTLPRECAGLIQHVRAAWTKGRRHWLALGLAGVLRKAGWSQQQVETLVYSICAERGDKELADRLQCVNDTFNQPIALVAGTSLLAQIV